MKNRHTSIYFILVVTSILASLSLFASKQSLAQEVKATAKKYIRIGSYQSHISAYGSERAWNNSYYEGQIWPADYLDQDNAVIKRYWITTEDFTDADDYHWDTYGLYFTKSYVGESLYPIELKQTAKFAPPTVYVDGQNTTAIYDEDVDEIEPDQVPDRIVTNIVNTSMGLTMTRRIYAFSQQYHDNYFIKEFIFTNTGNTDYDEDIELVTPLKGVRIAWGTRYSVCKEGAMKIGDGQSWGKHTWITKRGEDYSSHSGEKITEANPIVQWLRSGFCWAGQTTKNSFDNIGAPAVKGNGRLCAPQHAGIVCLHIDKSGTDKTDDPSQPNFLGWHAGDEYPNLGNMTPADESSMTELHTMISGNPYKGLGGNERMDEMYLNSNPDPQTVHNDAGGTNLMICYGPFDLEPGESVRIVEAEGVNGINRELCEEIGFRWKDAYDDPSDSGPFSLPDGSTTSDKDEFKNAWIYTGQDSIMLSFSRAKRNFDMDFNIPQPPLPPTVFEVNSGGDRISLSWVPSPSEGEAGFSGYKIYRAVGKYDTTYQLIADVGSGTSSYDDMTPVRGYSYYYYIVSYNDGSNNTTGDANPPGSLHSSRFYTRTTAPAYLKRQAGESLDDIRVVPNPYNISARDVQYPGDDVNKIMFLNIPGQCTIKIFTERGDLIETIDHNDGSGDEEWFLLNSARQRIVSGLYIAYFETPDGKSTYEKFMIIR